MKKLFIISGILTGMIFVLALMTAADVYMWKDEDGKIHMTKHKPPEGAEILKAIVHPTPTETPKYHPYATPRKKKTDKRKDDTVSTSASEPLGTPTPQLDDMGHDEAWWRNHKNSLKSSQTKNKNRIKEIKVRLYFLNEEALYDDPKEKNKLIEEMEDLEKKIEQTETELDDLEYSVKQAGGLPGWVRD